MTIADNDVPMVTIAATDATASEAGSDAGTFTITRTGVTTDPLTVTYTVSGTASSGDYTRALTGTVTLGAGQPSATITIAPVDDALFEGDETLVLTLAADAAYTVGTPGTATATIADNDVPTVTIAATDAAASEAGSDPGTFTITRTGVTTDPLTVTYTVSGTASSWRRHAGVDGNPDDSSRPAIGGHHDHPGRRCAARGSRDAHGDARPGGARTRSVRLAPQQSR